MNLLNNLTNKVYKYITQKEMLLAGFIIRNKFYKPDSANIIECFKQTCLPILKSPVYNTSYNTRTSIYL